MPSIPEQSQKPAGAGRPPRGPAAPSARPAGRGRAVPPWELRVSQLAWWCGVALFGVLILASFESGYAVGDRLAARKRARAQVEVAAVRATASLAPRPEPKPTPPLPAPATKDPPPARLPEVRELPPVVEEEPKAEVKKAPAPEPDRPKAEVKKTPVVIPPPVAPVVEVRFDRDVLPIFQSKCASCHGALSKRGGLDLRTLAAATRGGNSGPGVVPGQPGQSPVWETVRSGQMPPPNRAQLSASEKRTLLDWIAGGAR
ncbi:MAG TPA: c-type cytochrome domain-containing protein [Urbifossiella sp.]|jgi:hypothetical protein|nr:c-type cytochrome domain-containing protein [Urbifossiella sp.]